MVVLTSIQNQCWMSIKTDIKSLFSSSVLALALGKIKHKASVQIRRNT